MSRVRGFYGSRVIAIGFRVCEGAPGGGLDGLRAPASVYPESPKPGLRG